MVWWPPQETGELLSPPPGGPIGSWWTPLQKAKLIPYIVKTFRNVCQLSKLTPSAIRYLGRLLLLLLLANHLNNISSSKLVKASDHHLQGEGGVVRGAEPCVTNIDHAFSNLFCHKKMSIRSPVAEEKDGRVETVTKLFHSHLNINISIITAMFEHYVWAILSETPFNLLGYIQYIYK